MEIHLSFHRRRKPMRSHRNHGTMCRSFVKRIRKGCLLDLDPESSPRRPADRHPYSNTSHESQSGEAVPTWRRRWISRIREQAFPNARIPFTSIIAQRIPSRDCTPKKSKAGRFRLHPRWWTRWKSHSILDRNTINSMFQSRKTSHIKSNHAAALRIIRWVRHSMRERAKTPTEQFVESSTMEVAAKAPTPMHA